MFVKEVKYVDFNGNERVEKAYFNLSKAELTMWLSTSGDYTLDKVIERIYEERNGKKILQTFESLLHDSYGRPSVDGRVFEKSEEIWKEFYQSPAYSEVFMEIIGDAKKAADFINGIIPSDLAKEVAKAIKENPEGIPDEIKDYMIGDLKETEKNVQVVVKND